MSLFKKLIELEKEAAEFGFSWETATQIIEQIRSECAEIEDNLSVVAHPKLQEEIGDLLHAAFSLCVFCCFDPQDTLTKSITKFEKRFNHVSAGYINKEYY